MYDFLLIVVLCIEFSLFLNNQNTNIMKRNFLSLFILFGCLLNAQPYSNGNLSTGTTATASITAAPVGYTWSELQGTNTTLGASGFIGGTSDYRLADDFLVPATESWAISSVQVFCYQTSSTSMPIDGLTVRIFNGTPDSGTIVAGSGTTNIFDLTGTVDGLMYRTGNVTTTTTRRIWKVKGNMTATLNPGTYWLDFQVHAINDSSVFFPVVTNPGIVLEPGANGRQSTAGVYAALADTGSGNAQALPFIITYVATNLGTSETRQLDTRVIVYPNPTSDSFKLSLPQESIDVKTQIYIFDMSGKQVKNFKISESYDVRDLPKGMYLIKINDGKNIKTTNLIKH